MSAFKLYYSPTSCGAANYIVASMNGLEFDSEQVDVPAHKTASGEDFYKINPKGNVPTIVLPDGTILNENTATLTYLGSQETKFGMVPEAGSTRYYHYLNAMGFVASELHKSFGPLFNPNLDAETRTIMEAMAYKKAETFVSIILNGKKFVLDGDSPTAPDIYAYIVFSWAPYLKLDLSKIEGADQFSKRIARIPSVIKAHKEMKDAAASS